MSLCLHRRIIGRNREMVYVQRQYNPRQVYRDEAFPEHYNAIPVPQGSLSTGDINNSTEAGDKIMKVLRLRSFKPWPESMKVMTRQQKMDASALLEYFKPLHDYLIKENGKDVGWGHSALVTNIPSINLTGYKVI